ncbi:hypothetical protein OC846_000111 [Tilletia horrida]|uniref:Uncharacterized protein n=1 Tax=Tilletia horrida TaxID=155126 RepID=A0AAN6H1M5_9BASI|nr:hypothetical protein OC846_000111 [Tilletia horrida]
MSSSQPPPEDHSRSKERGKRRQEDKPTSCDPSHPNKRGKISDCYDGQATLEPPFRCRPRGYPEITFDPHHLYPNKVDLQTCDEPLLFSVKEFLHDLWKLQSTTKGKCVKQAKIAKFASAYILAARSKPEKVAPGHFLYEWRVRATRRPNYPEVWRLPDSFECPPVGGTAQASGQAPTAPSMDDYDHEGVALNTVNSSSHAASTSAHSHGSISTTPTATTSKTQLAATLAEAARMAAAEAAAAQEVAAQAAEAAAAATRVAAEKAAAAEKVAAAAAAAFAPAGQDPADGSGSRLVDDS